MGLGKKRWLAEQKPEMPTEVENQWKKQKRILIKI